jgi:hypothetical protein
MTKGTRNSYDNARITDAGRPDGDDRHHRLIENMLTRSSLLVLSLGPGAGRKIGSREAGWNLQRAFGYHHAL